MSMSYQIVLFRELETYLNYFQIWKTPGGSFGGFSYSVLFNQSVGFVDPKSFYPAKI